MFKIEGNKVFYSNEPVYEALGPIEDYEPYKESCIIRYRIPNDEKVKFTDEEICRNVLCVNFNGEVLWRLPKPYKGTLPFHPSYTTMAIGNDGSFRTSDGGYSIGFDPDTGEILERDFTK